MLTLIEKEVQRGLPFFYFHSLKNFNWIFFKISSKCIAKDLGFW